MTRKPRTMDELPSPFPKTRTMRFIELKHGKRLEDIIMSGTIYETGKKLGLSPSTVSKWRKIINEVFWKNFPEQGGDNGSQ